MKILIYIPVWQRREITELCYKSLKRTILSGPKGFDFVVLICASNDEDKTFAEQNGFDVVMCDNLPLGRKFNTGLLHGLDISNWDYVMQINSDNVLSVDFWEMFTEYFHRKLHFFGVDRVYFYDSDTKDMREFHYGSGCGIRFIRRDIVERAGFIEKKGVEVFELWTDYIDGGLDNDSSNNIFQRTKIMQYFARLNKIQRPVVVDIKSVINIHPFSEFNRANRLTESHRRQVMKRFPELAVFDAQMNKQKV